MYLLDNCIFYFAKYLSYSYVHLLITLFFHLVLNCFNSLCVLDVSPLSYR